MSRKCAIINYWWAWADAHGASLTALALYHLIEELGYEPCLITTIVKGENVEKCRAGRHFRFIEKYAAHTEKNYQSKEDYDSLSNEFDHFILGSDQVLRTEWVPDEWFLYMIQNESGSDRKNKIIMAGSFGGKELASSETRIKRVAGFLQDFSAVSVREKDGIEVYQRYFGKRSDIEWIMDPVFLIDPKFYYELMRNRTGNQDVFGQGKEVVFLYVLDQTPEVKWIKKRLSNQHDVVIVEDREELMAEDFLYLVSNCKMVITDSFHGTCFSIILNTPFYSIYNKSRGTSRIDTLREVFHLEHIMLEWEQVRQCDFNVPQIDYGRINEIIDIERKRGRNWLANKLVCG